jgi:hypothetical protein
MTTPIHTDMVDYYRRGATYYERVYHKPERQTDLRAMEAWLAPAPSPAAACSRWPAAPAGGRRTARATAAAGWPPT